MAIIGLLQDDMRWESLAKKMPILSPTQVNKLHKQSDEHRRVCLDHNHCGSHSKWKNVNHKIALHRCNFDIYNHFGMSELSQKNLQ